MPINLHIIDFIDKLAHNYDVGADRLVLKLIFFAIKPKSPQEKIKKIEQEAICKGWMKKQLWNRHPRWDLKGVVEFIDYYIEIVEVTEKYISLLHLDSGVINRLYNPNVDQDYVTNIKVQC